MATQKNRLNETVLLSTQNIMFKLMGKKIFTILRSKILFILTYVLLYFRGISSVVRKCTEKRTGKEYAVKIIDISGEKSDDYLAEQTKKDTVREINILRLCTGHPHISKYSGNQHS